MLALGVFCSGRAPSAERPGGDRRPAREVEPESDLGLIVPIRGVPYLAADDRREHAISGRRAPPGTAMARRSLSCLDIRRSVTGAAPLQGATCACLLPVSGPRGALSVTVLSEVRRTGVILRLGAPPRPRARPRLARLLRVDVLVRRHGVIGDDLHDRPAGIVTSTPDTIDGDVAVIAGHYRAVHPAVVRIR